MIILPVVPNHSMQCYVLVAAGSPACGESTVQYMPGSRDALKEHVGKPFIPARHRSLEQQIQVLTSLCLLVLVWDYCGEQIVSRQLSLWKVNFEIKNFVHCWNQEVKCFRKSKIFDLSSFILKRFVISLTEHYIQ